MGKMKPFTLTSGRMGLDFGYVQPQIPRIRHRLIVSNQPEENYYVPRIDGDITSHYDL
jgi:hypothetical protein